MGNCIHLAWPYNNIVQVIGRTVQEILLAAVQINTGCFSSVRLMRTAKLHKQQITNFAAIIVRLDRFGYFTVSHIKLLRIGGSVAVQFLIHTVHYPFMYTYTKNANV